jgi:hypothetical protein
MTFTSPVCGAFCALAINRWREMLIVRSTRRAQNSNTCDYRCATFRVPFECLFQWRLPQSQSFHSRQTPTEQACGASVKISTSYHSSTGPPGPESLSRTRYRSP